MKDRWASHLKEEMDFWISIFNGTFPNRSWIEHFRRTMAGVDIMPESVKKYYSNNKKVLDVGSGPASLIGGTFQGNRIDLTAVDPLAPVYEMLYEKFDLFPKVKPIPGEAEQLKNVISDKYDIVYSMNALDHCYDPIMAIQNMVDIANTSGVVIIECNINEGLRQNYAGLHQWNFMPANDDLIIWKKDNSASILSHVLRNGSYRQIKSSKITDSSFSLEISL